MPNNLPAGLILAAILSLGCARAGLAADDAGKVLSSNGDCYAFAGGERTALTNGTAVHVGDVVDVPQGAKLRLRMADGSTLSLASGTRMTILAYGVDPAGKRAVKLNLAAGLMRAVVATAGGGSSFEVDTGNSAAILASADWFDQTDPNKTTVGVLKGSVGFAARDAKGDAEPGGVTVPAGSVSEIAAAGAAPAPPAGRKAAARRVIPPKPAPTPPQSWTAAQFSQLVGLTNVMLGWCQCIADITRIHATCQSSVAACTAACGGGKVYSYIPDAEESCAQGSTAGSTAAAR